MFPLWHIRFIPYILKRDFFLPDLGLEYSNVTNDDPDHETTLREAERYSKNYTRYTFWDCDFSQTFFKGMSPRWTVK